MPRLRIKRVRFTVEADNRLRMLKARTGLTPNILCRMALCASLEERGDPATVTNGKGGREISRFTLLGEQDALYVLLLRQRHPTQDAEELESSFVGHLHRGITLLAGRLKGPESIAAAVCTPR